MSKPSAAPAKLRGVLSPAVTPFGSDLAPDAGRYLRHCRWLLERGCSGLAVFGTNSEANSLSVDERMMYLYHIPPVAQVGIPHALIERLLKAYPGTVAGIKDSSGDWDNTRALLERFGQAGFDVFAGSEVFLLGTLRGGGAGCITATGNVNPGPIDGVYRAWKGPDADRLQASISATRAIFQKYPMISALKAAIAHWSADKGWGTVRPPLTELTPAQARSLLQDFAAAGFDMPGLRSGQSEAA